MDCAGNKLTVKGDVDPSWLREKVEQKTKKKVELVSPQPKKDGGAGGDKKPDDKAEKKTDEKKKDEEKKPKEVLLDTETLSRPRDSWLFQIFIFFFSLVNLLYSLLDFQLIMTYLLFFFYRFK